MTFYNNMVAHLGLFRLRKKIPSRAPEWYGVLARERFRMYCVKS